MHFCSCRPEGWEEVGGGGYRAAMTEHSHDHDQDADPPTPDGHEPDRDQLEGGSEPASHPDPEPGAAVAGEAPTPEEDA